MFFRGFKSEFVLDMASHDTRGYTVGIINSKKMCLNLTLTVRGSTVDVNYSRSPHCKSKKYL